jgi:hypothetical protein
MMGVTASGCGCSAPTCTIARMRYAACQRSLRAQPDRKTTAVRLGERDGLQHGCHDGCGGCLPRLRLQRTSAFRRCRDAHRSIGWRGLLRRLDRRGHPRTIAACTPPMDMPLMPKLLKPSSRIHSNSARDSCAPAAPMDAQHDVPSEPSTALLSATTSRRGQETRVQQRERCVSASAQAAHAARAWMALQAHATRPSAARACARAAGTPRSPQWWCGPAVASRSRASAWRPAAAEGDVGRRRVPRG